MRAKTCLKWASILLLASASALMGQNPATIVTGTFQDPVGQVFANGSYTVTFVPTPGKPGPYTQNGVPFPLGPFNGKLDNTGLLTISTLADNSTVSPSGSAWLFKICPNTSTPCTEVTIPLQGSTQDISATVNAAIPIIVVKATPTFNRAYNSTEVAITNDGDSYLDYSFNCVNIAINGVWQCLTSGSGGGGGGGGSGNPATSPFTVNSLDSAQSLTITVPNAGGGNPSITSSTGTININHLFVTDLAGSGVSCLHTDASGNVSRSGADCGTGGGGGGGGGSGTVTNIGSLLNGQPSYGSGTSGTAIQTAPTELAADTFTGADICQQVMAAEAALPATGGVIRLSAQNYPVCAASITINKPGVTIRGAGMGNWGLGTGVTVLNFPAGVSGIIGTSGHDNMNIEGMYLKSASTVAGTDDGITLVGGSPRVARVIVQGFGRNGIAVQNNTDFWRMENVYSDHNKNDGFYWTPGCSDQNVGMASILSATSNGGYGYELQCAGANNFQTTHASGNLGGSWLVNVAYNYFYDTYVENDGHSTFTFTSTSAYNTAYFNAFGQPTPINDFGINSSNTIYFEGGGGSDGIYPAVTSFSLTGAPQATTNGFYSFIVGTNISYGYYPGELAIRDRLHGVNMAYYANGHGWNFLTPMTIGVDGSIAGVLNVSGISGAYHTTIKTQVTGANALFNLPATNGVSGQSLITDGSGNTSWSTITGGTGAVASVTGAGSVSCVPTTGNVICTGSSTGITNSAPANVVTKSDGTNVVASSITDNATTVVTTEPFNAATLSTGAGASGCPISGCWSMSESSTPGTPTLGYDYCRADSATHGLLCSFNGNSEVPLGGTGGGLADPGANGIIKRTALNTTAIAVVADYPTLNQNTTGTAANLSGTPALPNGTTATTQTAGDNSTKIATDAFVLANTGTTSPCSPLDKTQLCIVEDFIGGGATTGIIGTNGWNITTIGSAGGVSYPTSVWPHVGVVSLNTSATATQFQGESIYLVNQNMIPALNTNTNWSLYMNFQLQDITTSQFIIGFLGTVNSYYPSYLAGLRYNVNNPISSPIAITSIVCTTTTCTVTDSGGTLSLPGQTMTIAGATCSYRTVNGNQVMNHFTNATTWTFASSGSSGETCPTPGTVATVAETTFKVTTNTGNLQNATVVDTGVAADTAWHSLVIQSSTAGTLLFTLDAGSPITINTFVPVGNTTIGAILCTDVTLTTAKSVYLDRVVFQMTGLTR